jgi:hypothetical protein
MGNKDFKRGLKPRFSKAQSIIALIPIGNRGDGKTLVDDQRKKRIIMFKE